MVPPVAKQQRSSDTRTRRKSAIETTVEKPDLTSYYTSHGVDLQILSELTGTVTMCTCTCITCLMHKYASIYGSHFLLYRFFDIEP